MIATGRVVVVAYNESGIRVGETHPNASIPDETVDKIRELHEDDGLSYQAIADKLQISLSTVRKICSYERRAQTPSSYRRLKVSAIFVGPIQPMIFKQGALPVQPDTVQMIRKLREQEGLPCPEIAQKLRMNYNTVKSIANGTRHKSSSI